MLRSRRLRAGSRGFCAREEQNARSRHGAVFPAWIAVGDGAPVYTRIPVPVSVQRRLVEY